MTIIIMTINITTLHNDIHILETFSGAFITNMLSVVLPSVILSSVILLNVILLNVMLLSFCQVSFW
jgi:hypothetical protein